MSAPLRFNSPHTFIARVSPFDLCDLIDCKVKFGCTAICERLTLIRTIFLLIIVSMTTIRRAFGAQSRLKNATATHLDFAHFAISQMTNSLSVGERSDRARARGTLVISSTIRKRIPSANREMDRIVHSARSVGHGSLDLKYCLVAGLLGKHVNASETETRNFLKWPATKETREKNAARNQAGNFSRECHASES